MDSAAAVAVSNMKSAVARLTIRLGSLGLRKRAGLVFTKNLDQEVIGWLGLNKASRHLAAGQLEVNPVVGIRHQTIERVVAELRGEKFHAYQPPTVSSPLGYLMPGSRYRGWLLGPDDAADNADELVASFEAFGLPFIQSNSSLAAVCELLDQRFGYDHQIVYRRPVAWMLAGNFSRSFQVLDEAEAKLGDRDDAAALEFRSFITAFHNRFGVSSSD